jgi:protoporphyrinogen oxidase
MAERHVIVLGGGVTGLSTAYRLAQEGWPVTLLETNSRLGGQAGSVPFRGCTFDYGPHAFHSPDKSLTDWYLDLLHHQVYTKPKFVQIKFQGKLFNYPLKPTNVFMSLPPLVALRCGLSYLITTAQNRTVSRPIRSAEDFFVTNYGWGLYRIFFEGYTAKVWGIPAGELSASFIQNRMPRMSLAYLLISSVAKRAARQRLLSRHQVPYELVWYYPAHGGCGTFTLRLAEEAKAHGAEILLNARVTRVHTLKREITGVTYRQDQREEYIQGTHLISSIPITSLLQVMEPKIDAELKAVADTLYFRGLIIICLVVKKPTVFNPQTIYFTNRFFNRLGQMNNYSPDVVPDGKSGITAEITCTVGDEVWRMADDTLCQHVIADMEAEGLLTRAEVEDSMVLHYEHGYPVYSIGYEECLRAVRSYLATFPNLFVGGRQGLFNYAQMHFCVSSGFAMADRIMSGLPKTVNLEDDPEEVLFV